MSVIFDVLVEENRRRILELVRERPRAVGELVRELGLTQPGTSKHLRVMRQAGLLEVRPDGQRRIYELRAEPLAELDAWLEPYRVLWSASLDALELNLDTNTTGPPVTIWILGSRRGSRDASTGRSCPVDAPDDAPRLPGLRAPINLYRHSRRKPLARIMRFYRS
jgi:DNA-binding transcriptional ArsR family regulator